MENAFDVCVEITRREAKINFYGMRLLRLPERGALSAVYVLARRIDDVLGIWGDPATTGRAGGRDRAEEVAAEHLKGALDSLSSARLERQPVLDLEAGARFTVERDR